MNMRTLAYEYCLVALTLTIASATSRVLASTALDEATAAYSAGHYERCCEVLAPLVLRSELNNAAAHYLYANSLFRCGRVTDAREVYKQAILLKPDLVLKKYCVTGIQACDNALSASTAQNGHASARGYVGLGLDRYFVQSVFPGSPAMLSGVKQNDKILSVNGEKTIALTTDQITRMITGAVGTHVHLEIERGISHMKFDLARAVAPPALYIEEQKMAATSRALDTVRASGERVYHYGKQDKIEPKVIEVPKTPIHADSDDVALIKIHRRTQDTAEVYDDVVRALHAIPKQLKKDLLTQGYSILICPMVNEAEPEKIQEKPRGYVYGGGQDNVFGLCQGSKKTILIAERASYHSSMPAKNPDTVNTALHELGHAYDYCTGLSSSPPFSTDYAEDSSKLTNTQRTEFQYFVQDGNAGAQETFAELFMLACTPAGQIDQSSIELGKTFSHSFEYVKERVRGLIAN